MKLIFNAGSYKVALPKQIVETVVKWKNGDELVIQVTDNKIIISKKENE